MNTRTGSCGFVPVLLLWIQLTAIQAGDLSLEIDPRFDGAPLVFDEVRYAVGAGRQISVTRLDLLLSGFAVQDASGDWILLTNQFAYVNGREGRTHFTLQGVPSGDVQTLRFHIGVAPEWNHADPAQFSAGHALNPSVNGLHWNWQGGYVFLALEGLWRMETGSLSGYAFHLANDGQLMTVTLPLTMKSETRLQLALHVDRLFQFPNAIDLTETGNTTHSRAGDLLAGKLRINAEHAFGTGFLEGPAIPMPAGESGDPLMAPDAKPYRLAVSSRFPVPDLPGDNPLTEAGVALGRSLFHDSLLSLNNRQSCASCHQENAAFVDAGRAVSIGAEGRAGTRNSMPLLNLAWKQSFFWDGRAATLRQQVLMPIENPVEMHESLNHVVAKLAATGAAAGTGNGNTDYPALFARAFGSPQITADRISRALEQFLLTRVSQDSKFDLALRGEAELTAEEIRGFELFHTEYDPGRGLYGADCFHCHGGPLFRNVAFANNGLDAVFVDQGRAAVSGRPGDTGRFAVPSLRNVAVTAPYMHDGRFAMLEEVLRHYAGEVKRSPTLDPNLAKHPAGGVPLTDAD
jgi:cytochrome c peroxidase